MSVQVPKDESFINQNTGSMDKPAMNFFNKISSRLNAMGAVAAPASANATDLASVITLANELKTILTALNTAANK